MMCQAKRMFAVSAGVQTFGISAGLAGAPDSSGVDAFLRRRYNLNNLLHRGILHRQKRGVEHQRSYARTHQRLLHPGGFPEPKLGPNGLDFENFTAAQVQNFLTYFPKVLSGKDRTELAAVDIDGDSLNRVLSGLPLSTVLPSGSALPSDSNACLGLDLLHALKVYQGAKTWRGDRESTVHAISGVVGLWDPASQREFKAGVKNLGALEALIKLENEKLKKNPNRRSAFAHLDVIEEHLETFPVGERDEVFDFWRRSANGEPVVQCGINLFVK